jgi:hypothetical protein
VAVGGLGPARLASYLPGLHDAPMVCVQDKVTICKAVERSENVSGLRTTDLFLKITGAF